MSAWRWINLPRNLVKTFAAQSYDVVLDYLWGEPVMALITALMTKSMTKETPRTRLIQVGAMAGDPISLLPAHYAVRGWKFLGSGIGSVSIDAISLKCFPKL